MLSRLLPREVEFFRFFRESAEELLASSRDFLELVKDPVGKIALVESIARQESKGDEVTHTTMKLLHETFITPLDREDIHSLISRLDDIHDAIHAAAQRVKLFEIKSLPSEVIGIAEIAVHMAEINKKMMGRLNHLKHPDLLLEEARSLHKLESDADHLMRQGLAKLFKHENDVKNLLMTKEVMELIERATDCCADVASIVEGIVLEYA